MKEVVLGLFVALVLAGCGQIYGRETVGGGCENNEFELCPGAWIMGFDA